MPAQLPPLTFRKLPKGADVSVWLAAVPAQPSPLTFRKLFKGPDLGVVLLLCLLLELLLLPSCLSFDPA
jgi:hypothetical protein